MNGEKIRNLEELKENFDLDTAAQYLLDGKLLTWLEDRFYEDEADQVREIDTNSPSMKQALCNVFGIEYEDDSGMDTEELERLNEKKRVLKSMTDDESIIANAAKTALDQEDLAELLEAGEDFIYLCGESFTIPIRFNNKKYVGILSNPSIKIKAKNLEELEEKGINFENVILPWANETISNTTTPHVEVNAPIVPRDILETYLTTNFPEFFSFDDLECHKWWQGCGPDNEWESAPPNDNIKTICLKTICQGKYNDKDILHIHMDEKLRAGWALTIDSFCAGGNLGKAIIPYQDIISANFSVGDGEITTTQNNKIYKFKTPDWENIFFLFSEGLVDFLLGVKDFINAETPMELSSNYSEDISATGFASNIDDMKKKLNGLSTNISSIIPHFPKK